MTTFPLRRCNCACVCFLVKEDVLAPPPENDDVVNDFDIEEEVIEVENRSDLFCVSAAPKTCGGGGGFKRVTVSV